MNIYEKLLEVSKEVSYLQKENKGNQYSYVSSSQTLAAVKTKMDELGLLLIPSITDKTVREKEEFKNERQKTITYFTELDMTMTWVNVEKPEEKLLVPWYTQGVDIAGEKGVGKALTYGEKYFLLKFFHIATDKDDPDAFQKKHEETPPAPKKYSPVFGEIMNAMSSAKSLDELNKAGELIRIHATELRYSERSDLVSYGTMRKAEIGGKI